MARLTKDYIESFLGHVLPLGLVTEEEIRREEIEWITDSDAVRIDRYDEGDYPSSRGVLLTLMKLGEATVTAVYRGESYKARVKVREMRRAREDASFKHYIGDLHAHTSVIHKRPGFAEEGGIGQDALIERVESEGKLDFTVMSDHGDVISDKYFLEQFFKYEEYPEKPVVIFPSSESEVTLIETDRLGRGKHHSGEIVMINSNNYSEAKSWEEFYSDFRDTPLPIGTFAHPQVQGGGDFGLWNHRPDINATEDLKRIVKLIELGDGTLRSQNMLHEYSYSLALDYGFRVSPTASSDNHGPIWGYDSCPGKTVILAEEKSEEAFIDAMLAGRVYATESGCVKLSYSVNRRQAPAELDPSESTYRFRVELGLLRDEPEAMPTEIEVISDFGNTVYECEPSGEITEFTIRSDSARYFYLRLTDCLGRHTWSMPIYLGRAPEVYRPCPSKPLGIKHHTAYDELSGKSAGEILTTNIEEVFRAEGEEASIIIDLMNPKYVDGIGHYPEFFDRDTMKQQCLMPGFKYASFPSRYRVSTSLDGVHYTKVAEGRIRIFGSEEMICFPEHIARFVRFEILSTVGKESKKPLFRSAHPSVAILTVFGRE